MSRIKHLVLTIFGVFLALAALGIFATVGLAVLGMTLLIAVPVAFAMWARGAHTPNTAL